MLLQGRFARRFHGGEGGGERANRGDFQQCLDLSFDHTKEEKMNYRNLLMASATVFMGLAGAAAAQEAATVALLMPDQAYTPN